ncbi:Na+/H+ antiporter NhaC family protein [Lactobacillus crispatus]|uniref:Na+/H+ antiporter NhaC family protein n=1 Tax=Lactobacillus crispatus TaxID=47770 RepID=UPI000B5DA11F|nr:Na+/H+ antiporter NhaC family protein [Lactobacillus crispatus]OXC32936.1 sodium:proton antiporter [Lactobacillus crispatus]OXC33599.1 sodium:proton antiporter [Lactobacillus crispatus]
MDEEEKKKGPSSFMGLMPLIGFLILYILSGLISGKFDSMPLLVGMIIAGIIGLALPAPKGQKKLSIAEKVNIFCEAGGESGLMMMVVIFILAGAFQGVATKMHAVSSVTNLGLSILPQNMILPGIFLIGCILSFAMGTSMGTIAALMPVGVMLAQKTGINPLVIAGAVIGGAMFGDNNSFISASAIAAVQSQKVLMKKKFLLNFMYYIPAIVLNCVFLALYPIKHIALTGNSYSYNVVDIIPYLIVIVLSLCGMNVMNVLMVGIVSGIVIGIIHGDFSLIGSMTYIQQGMAGMEDMAVICIFVGGVVGLMKYLGGIQWLIDTLSKNTKTQHGAELSIGMLIVLLCVATTNNTVAIITVGPMAQTIGKKFHLSRTRVAAILSMFATNVQGFIPYAGQCLVAAGMLHVSPMAVVPWVWYCYLTLAMSLVLVFTKFPKVKNEALEGYDNFENLSDDGTPLNSVEDAAIAAH